MAAAAATATVDLSPLDRDPRLFLYTSLTAGSSHIVTATSRMETILRANRIAFQAVDLATDERARRLWQRRGGGRKLPGLVREGFILGDLDAIEEWNEFGELKENIGPVPPSGAAVPPGGLVGVNIAPPSVGVSAAGTAGVGGAVLGGVSRALLPGVDGGEIRAFGGAAAKEKEEKKGEGEGVQVDGKATMAMRSVIDELLPTKVETMRSAPVDKEHSISEAKEASAAASSASKRASGGEGAVVSGGSAAPVGEEHGSNEAGEASGTETRTAPVEREHSITEASSTAPSTTKTASGGEGTAASEAPAGGAPESSGSESDDEEEEDEDESESESGDESAAKGIQGLHVGQGEKTQEQSAADGGEAGKSVED
ncbi:hypothetical protein LTR08_001554 [Meristemomyces frigidus]|nr:hypothetical protein LTR08_001554 [Meristemomyces frigidus]